MGRIVYLDGEYLDEGEAQVSIFDRGFVMADAIYEVTAVMEGRLVDFAGHIRRLHRSLSELQMPAPFGDDRLDDELLAIHRELIARNALVNGSVYLQITRGNGGDRDFLFPPEGTPPTLVLFTQARDSFTDLPEVRAGLRVISLPDLRWHRRDIKTTQLLWPSLAKMAAIRAGVNDAWLVEDGLVTEGSSSNAWIVKEGVLITRALSHDLLAGITRAAVLRLAHEAQLKVEERSFSIAEAQAADEAFITSSNQLCMPVVQIDGTAIGDGKPGKLTLRLRELYLEEALRSAI